MKAKNCLIFGGSGQIGRNLIRKLTKKNYQVTVVTRNIHQKSYIIKTQANAGYIDIVESNIFEEQKLRKLFEKADVCINLIGILFESRKGNTFKNIHTVFPSLLSTALFSLNVFASFSESKTMKSSPDFAAPLIPKISTGVEGGASSMFFPLSFIIALTFPHFKPLTKKSPFFKVPEL